MVCVAGSSLVLTPWIPVTPLPCRRSILIDPCAIHEERDLHVVIRLQAVLKLRAGTGVVHKCMALAGA